MMRFNGSNNRRFVVSSDDEEEELVLEETQETQETQQPQPTQQPQSTQQPQPTQQPQSRQSRQTYAEYRDRCRRDNYIATSNIDMVFSHHFPNSVVIHNINEDIKLCSIKIRDLLNANVKNWEFNRQPDQVRVPEIARYIYNSRKHINTHFYLSYNNKNDRFDIIDGSHRHWALKMLQSLSVANGEILDNRLRNNDETLTTWFNPQENIEWLLNNDTIVQINFKSSDNDLRLLRDDINNSQPMPIELRNISQDIEKNGIINRIADEYINKYKQCFASNSVRDDYMKNNRKTNRDKFVVLLSRLYDKYNIDINRVGILQQRLEIANDIIRCELQENRLRRRCNKEDIKNKCRETGCYLFLYRDEELFNLI